MIKEIKRSLCLLFLLPLCICSFAEQKETYGVESLLVGADALGRGGAYLGGRTGGSPVFQNFSAKTGARVSLTAFKLIGEINYLSAAYAQNGFGLGFLTVQDSAGYRRDEDNNLLGGRIGYSDSTVYGACALELGRLNLGLRLKYTDRIMTEVDSAKGYSLDLSAGYSLNEHWSFGGELTNASFTALHWADGARELFPVAGGLGVGYSVFGREQRLNLYSDLYFENGGGRWSGGLDWRPADLLALRGGFIRASSWQDGTIVQKLKPTAGLGLNLFGLTFDYAYNPGDDLAENITHFFTLGYLFNSAESGAVPAESVAESAPPEEAQSAAEQKPARKRLFRDIEHLPPEDQLLIEDIGYLRLIEGQELPNNAPPRE
jgi:hypothetical protein